MVTDRSCHRQRIVCEADESVTAVQNQWRGARAERVVVTNGIDSGAVRLLQ